MQILLIFLLIVIVLFFFFKDIRNISIYSTDYCFLRNQIFTLVGLKKPNKFRKRENGITVSSQIV